MKFVSFLAALTLSLSSLAIVKVGDTGLCTDLSMIQRNGQEFTKSACEASQPNGLLLLDFVSATCTYCIGSLPHLAEFTKETEGKLTVRQVGVDRNPDLLREYWKEHQEHMVFDLALDTERKMKNAYEISAVPTYVLIDKNKKVLFVNVGALNESNYNTIRQIIQKQSE